MKIMTGIDLHSTNALCGRMLLVRQRTTLILSFKSLHERTLGQRVATYQVKTMGPRGVAAVSLLVVKEMRQIEACYRALETTFSCLSGL